MAEIPSRPIAALENESGPVALTGPPSITLDLTSRDHSVGAFAVVSPATKSRMLD